MRYKNVVVFGDSLSDIGIKWTSVIGKIGRMQGEMTVNPTGRFSDCRNWTDYMFEDAAGSSLVRSDAASTISASKLHQRINKDRVLLGGSEQAFRYANYAEGGACGGIPSDKIMRYIALTTFKSQVQRFGGDYKTMNLGTNEPFLFLVWFGANDLYTANAPSTAMGAVAKKVAAKRRAEVATIVGGSPRFVFVNLALPLSSVRYDRLLEGARTAKKEASYRTALSRLTGRGFGKSAQSREKEAAKKLYETRMLINNFESGALLFNNQLRECAASHGDVYIDMASVVSKDNLSGLLEGMKLVPGTQPKGTSDRFRTAHDVDEDDEWEFVATSDEAHPTSRVYKLMWDHLKSRLNEEQISFGKL